MQTDCCITNKVLDQYIIFFSLIALSSFAWLKGLFAVFNYAYSKTFNMHLNLTDEEWIILLLHIPFNVVITYSQ